MQRRAYIGPVELGMKHRRLGLGLCNLREVRQIPPECLDIKRWWSYNKFNACEHLYYKSDLENVTIHIQLELKQIRLVI